MPARQVVPVRGAMIGAATDVDEAIENAAVSERMRRLLHKAKREAFSTAGYQQYDDGPAAAEPGLWCCFSLAQWARELARFKITRTYLWRLRVQAEELGFFTYHQDPDDPTRGYLRWNLDFSSWTALDPEYQRLRYHREGAGRKSVQSKVIRSLAADSESKVDGGESKVIRLPVRERIKSDTLACPQPPTEAAPPALLRIQKETEEPPLSTAGARGREAAEEEARAIMDALAERMESHYAASLPPERVVDAIPASAPPATTYDSPMPREPRRMADLPPKLAAEVQPILDTLHDALGWKTRANDEALLLGALKVRELPWVHLQALRFAAKTDGSDGRKQPHTMQAFMGWLIGETADRMYDEWQARQRDAQAAREQTATPPMTATPKRQGDSQNAARSPRRSTAPAAAARPGAASARPRFDTGDRTDRRPLWEQD